MRLSASSDNPEIGVGSEKFNNFFREYYANEEFAEKSIYGVYLAIVLRP